MHWNQFILLFDCTVCSIALWDPFCILLALGSTQITCLLCQTIQMLTIHIDLFFSYLFYTNQAQYFGCQPELFLGWCQKHHLLTLVYISKNLTKYTDNCDIVRAKKGRSMEKLLKLKNRTIGECSPSLIMCSSQLLPLLWMQRCIPDQAMTHIA